MQQFIGLLFLALMFTACDNGCASLDCKHDGSCYEGQCLCTKWYSGEECQLQFNRNYEGVYVGTYSEGDRSQLDNLEVEAHYNVPNRMVLPNGVYFEFVDESLLVIPRQQFFHDDDTLTIEGGGNYSSEALHFFFGLDSDSDSLVSFSGTRNY